MACSQKFIPSEVTTREILRNIIIIITGYVRYDDLSHKTVNTKYGTSQVKEDVEFLDHTGVIPIHV